MKNGWSKATIGDVAEAVERVAAPQPGQVYRQIGVRLWGDGAYERESIDGSQTKYKTFNRTEQGDIIVNKIWARNGSVSVVSPELADCYCSAEFPLFAPNRRKLEPRWFYWITKTKWFWNACDIQSRGTSGQNRIRPEQFLQIAIPLPPLAEQRRIVATLDQLAAKIEEATLLSKSLDKERDLLTASIFGKYYAGLSGKSPVRPLSDLTSKITDGPHKTPSYVEEGIPFVTVQNMVTGTLSFSNLKYLTEADHLDISKRCLPERGDVLYSKDGATRGNPCYIDTDRVFNIFVSVALIKPIRDVLDGRYLCHMLRSNVIRDLMRERSRGDMIPHIVLGEIAKFPIPVPTLRRQRDVVRALDHLAEQIGALQAIHARRKSEIDALLLSILDKAFCGEL